MAGILDFPEWLLLHLTWWEWLLVGVLIGLAMAATTWVICCCCKCSKNRRRRGAADVEAAGNSYGRRGCCFLLAKRSKEAATGGQQPARQGNPATGHDSAAAGDLEAANSSSRCCFLLAKRSKEAATGGQQPARQGDPATGHDDSTAAGNIPPPLHHRDDLPPPCDRHGADDDLPTPRRPCGGGAGRSTDTEIVEFEEDRGKNIVVEEPAFFISSSNNSSNKAEASSSATTSNNEPAFTTAPSPAAGVTGPRRLPTVHEEHEGEVTSSSTAPSSSPTPAEINNDGIPDAPAAGIVNIPDHQPTTEVISGNTGPEELAAAGVALVQTPDIVAAEADPAAGVVTSIIPGEDNSTCSSLLVPPPVVVALPPPPPPVGDGSESHRTT